MPVHNAEIAGMFYRLADLLEIEEANPFRVRAYRNAARTVENLSRPVGDMIAAGEDLTDLPGIGEDLAKKLKEMNESGHLAALEKEEKHLPPTLTDLLKIPGLGPKRVRHIYEKLDIKDRKDLERAVQSGKLRSLEGFGSKTEAQILEYLKERHEGGERMLYAAAEEFVESLLKYLRGVKGVGQAAAAGSFRRRRETVGDVDILAACANGEDVMRAFTKYEEVSKVLAHGETRSSVVLRSGLHVDLRVVKEESYGAALHYFTGSKAHNIAVRTRGVKEGLKINEYGVFRGEKRVGGTAEGEVFKAVGLPFIEPELRENRGEIEAAEKGKLPKLLKLEDMRGDLQCHTNFTDGRETLEKMAESARKKDYEYLGITDHSKRLAIAHGLNATRLAVQIREIDKLNEKMKGFRILKSIEVDILEDGALDLSDDILKELNFVLVAVHHKFNLSREKQTERIIRAMDNPYVSILAHPTGRLINERKPYDVDMEKLLRAAKERGCYLEVDAQPSRLDLDDVHCRMAKELGVRLAVSTDAHSAMELDFMRFGVGQARRGWLEAEDVLNTRSLSDLTKLLKRK